MVMPGRRFSCGPRVACVCWVGIFLQRSRSRWHKDVATFHAVSRHLEMTDLKAQVKQIQQSGRDERQWLRERVDCPQHLLRSSLEMDKVRLR